MKAMYNRNVGLILNKSLEVNMKQKQERTVSPRRIATVLTVVTYLLILLTGCGGPSNEEKLTDQVNQLVEQTNSQSETIAERDKTITELQEQIKTHKETISNLEEKKEDQEKVLEDLNIKVKNLEDENKQLSQLLQSISEIPERYKEVFVKTSELQFVATLFNTDIRALKIDIKNNKVTDMRTDTELELKGIHNNIQSSYGYEFTMEEFLSGETGIEINGKYYSVVGIPTMLEGKALDGKVSLYDICQTLVVLRAEKDGQFFYSTQY